MIEEKKRKNTKVSYNSAIVRMKSYDPLLSIRTFEDIDADYIKKMDAAWEKLGLKTNSRAVYMRNIRAVFNDAIDAKITTAYPFREFSIKKAPTPKRNLSVQELRMLRDYPIVNEFQEKYRDIFMLCFYMRGINMVDLLALTKDNVRAGRINYIRSKTGKFYSVKIEPEIKAILDRYKGKQYLLDVCDGAENQEQFVTKYEGFLQRMNRGLKKIGPYTRKGLGGKKEIKPILPQISQYWCRHTTATLMAEIGYREEIIVCSLGHEHLNKVTNIYIEYKQSDVDAANRALIDYTFQKNDKRTTEQPDSSESGGIGQNNGNDH
jgi:site-specific recombinase XerD